MILKIQNLKKHYTLSNFLEKKHEFMALRGIDLEIKQGEVFSVVGESGCGKSTLAKVIMGIEDFSEGEIALGGKSLRELSRTQISEYVQMIFQDPNSSLNPRKTILHSLCEPLVIQGQLGYKEIQNKMQDLAHKVGIQDQQLLQYPHMLSGGQKQRVVMARALSTEPKLLICDEPVSALDLSVQAQVLNLLMDLQQTYKISLLFISHDLNVVRFLSDQVAVMYLGNIIEQGSRDDIFKKPQHPYTKLLLNSIPESAWEENDISYNVDMPSPLNPPSGCHFRTRCPIVSLECAENFPPAKKKSDSFGSSWAKCFKV